MPVQSLRCKKDCKRLANELHACKRKGVEIRKGKENTHVFELEPAMERLPVSPAAVATIAAAAAATIAIAAATLHSAALVMP